MAAPELRLGGGVAGAPPAPPRVGCGDDGPVLDPLTHEGLGAGRGCSGGHPAASACLRPSGLAGDRCASLAACSSSESGYPISEGSSRIDATVPSIEQHSNVRPSDAHDKSRTSSLKRSRTTQAALGLQAHPLRPPPVGESAVGDSVRVKMCGENAATTTGDLWPTKSTSSFQAEVSVPVGRRSTAAMCAGFLYA
eukprot:scaffold57857_cov31-Tisochrysis_lutea.AAC.2